jgi:hypothetical protein
LGIQRRDLRREENRESSSSEAARPRRKRPDLPDAGIVGAFGRVTTMTTLPADEDYARAVLAIFQAEKVRARQCLRIADVKAAFVARNMGRPADFEAALEYAIGQGWMAPALDMLRLTASGADEMHTV